MRGSGDYQCLHGRVECKVILLHAYMSRTLKYLCVHLSCELFNLHIHVVSLFIRCTMRCEIWAQPAELSW